MYTQHFPAKYIRKGYREQEITDILALQEERLKNCEENPLFLLIMDDIVSSDTRLRYSEALKRLGYEGRHSGVCVMITSQYTYAIPPGMHVYSLSRTSSVPGSACRKPLPCHRTRVDVLLSIVPCTVSSVYRVWCIRLVVCMSSPILPCSLVFSSSPSVAP